MSFQYDDQIVTTESGALDLEFYRQEANRIRSEYLWSVIVKGVKSVTGFVASVMKNNGSAVDNFLLHKTVK